MLYWLLLKTNHVDESSNRYCLITFLLLMFYQCRVEAWDSQNPDRRVSGDLTININRNPNGPQFTRTRYDESISQNYPVGERVLDVEARDLDGVSSDALFSKLISF